MQKTVILVLVLFTFINLATAEHVSVIITEQTVNAFLSAVGPVTGHGKKRGVNYNWKVKKSQFDFEPGSATFIANVGLKAGPLKTSDVVKSKVNIRYDVEANKIKMEVDQAIYKIYIKILGQKIKVGEIDIAKYYKPKFEFNGPQPIQKIVEVNVGENKTREITATTTRQELVLEKDQVRISVDLEYSGTDKK